MKSPLRLWDLFVQAKGWGVRPSQLLGLEDDSYVAYCVDEAIGRWGNFVKGRMEEVTERAKNPKAAQRKQDLEFHRLFADELDGKTKGRFRDPVDVLKKK